MVKAAQNEEILRLRISGMPLREIGKRVGLSHQGVANRLTELITATTQPLATELRQLELERLDRLTFAATEILEQEDGTVLAAIDRLLRVQERRAKLLGLDAPQQLDIVQEQRIDLDSELVADALAAALNALELSEEQRTIALAAAQQKLAEAASE
ncbi:hypothetical protein QNO07_09185 [Streptomyces sp. 549]|uniref:hypothetical protein n=1 Tax=Streptomyces sp. 549 TaxID=3049076 RepID=UPI0024C3F251|nr:hypothetical protein [Streptomyces sp. 549]MDK1473591.1 hypothetical protein [Streptomyces sp. 549]